MAKLQPKSYKIGQTLQSIKVKELFNSEEIVLVTQDSVNDNEIYVATNPNSTDVRTVELSVTPTAVIGNNYTEFSDSGSQTIGDVQYLYYTSSDTTGIIQGETVTISQGAENYTTTVHSIVTGDIILNDIDGFTPANSDILIFNHSNWYYVTADDISKVAKDDKFKVTLDDDGTIQILEVVAKDATHIGFKKVTDNYATADVIVFDSDLKLDNVAISLKSNDYPNGLLFKHASVNSTSNNLAIIPKSEYNQAVKFFF
jgi:hypothetical protein